MKYQDSNAESGVLEADSARKEKGRQHTSSVCLFADTETVERNGLWEKRSHRLTWCVDSDN